MDLPLKSPEEVVSSRESLRTAFLKSALGLAIGVAIVVLVVRWTGVSWSDLLVNLASASPWRVALAILGTFFLSASQAVRWAAVLKGIASIRFWVIFQSKLVGYAANSILPARLGDLVRVEFVSTLSGIPRSKILATGVVDLWFDKIGWIVTFAIAYFVAPMPEWTLKAMSIMGAVIIAFGVILFFVARMKIQVKPDSFLARFREGLNQPGFLWMFAKQLWLSPLSWCWETLMVMFVASAFGIHLDFSQAFAVLTAMNISMAVPIPANVGAFEASVVYTLKAFGVAPDLSVAFALSYHLIFLVPGVIAGAIIFSSHSNRFGILNFLKKSRVEGKPLL